jgi:hypothetical protein
MRPTLLYIFIILLIPASLCAQGTGKHSLPSAIPHPRIFLDKKGEKNIRTMIRTDSLIASMHRTILRQSDEYLDAPLLQRELTGKSMLKVSRTALQYIYYLSWSWRLTGSSRYAERAAAELRNVCKFPDWNPSHFLDAAEMTLAVSLGYDWLYNYLDAATRKLIEESILKKGLLESLPETATSKENYSWLKKKNNWNAVCNASMAIGAIAIYDKEPELCKKIIERSVRLVREVALAEYLPDGNYPEGYSYWSYGTSFTILLIEALEKIYNDSFGLASHKGLLASPEYMLHMSTQNNGCYAYADCFTDRTLAFPMFWFAKRTGNHALLWAESQKLALLKNRGLSDAELFNTRLLPSVLIWTASKTFSGMTSPAKRMFVGQGTTPVALLRNHWGGKDEIFLGLKGGSCSTNHSHMDIGSFVMYRGDRQWITDAGAQEYYSLEKYGFMLGDRSQHSRRWDVRRIGPGLHNLMTFNGARQNVNTRAGIELWGERPGFLHAITDLTAIDSGQVTNHRRGVAILEDKYVVVRDEVKNADHYTDLRWAILTPASVSVKNNNEIELTLNGEKMLMKVLGKNISIRTWPASSGYSFDAPNDGMTLVGFTSTLEPGKSESFTVYFIPEGVKINGIEMPSLSAWGNFKK